MEPDITITLTFHEQHALLDMAYEEWKEAGRSKREAETNDYAPDEAEEYREYESLLASIIDKLESNVAPL